MRKRLTIAALVVVVCSILAWGGYRLLDRIPTFLVSRITIAGTERCDQKRIRKFTDPAYGQCIFKVNLSDLHRKIHSIGWIKSLSIRRVMPSTLEVQVQERVPLGILSVAGSTGILPIGRQGYSCSLAGVGARGRAMMHRQDACATTQLYLVDAEGVLIDVVQNKKVWKSLPLITGLDLHSMTSALSALSAYGSSKAPRIDLSALSAYALSAYGRSYLLHSDGTSMVANGSSMVADGNGTIPPTTGYLSGLYKGGRRGDYKGPSPGLKVDSLCLESALQALTLMQAMKVQWLAEISEIKLKNPENITLCSKGWVHEIRLGTNLFSGPSTNNNLREKLMYLQTTWSSIKARGEGPCSGSGYAQYIEYIDLRYKNQLIVKPHLE